MSLFRTQDGWPQGRPKLAQEFIDANKRELCVHALSELAHERGIPNVTAGEIVRRAQISRGRFYELFGSRDEAFRFAFAFVQGRLSAALADAIAGPEGRQEKVEAAIGALVERAVVEPREVEMCLVHSVTLPERAHELHVPETVGALAAVLRGDRHGPDDERAPGLEDFVAEAIVSMLARRLRNDEIEALPQVGGELVALTLCALPTATACR